MRLIDIEILTYTSFSIWHYRLYDRNVPYISMRLFAVACGVGLIPISYLTIKKSGHSTQAAMICAVLLTFGKTTKML